MIFCGKLMNLKIQIDSFFDLRSDIGAACIDRLLHVVLILCFEGLNIDSLSNVCIYHVPNHEFN